MAGAKRDRSPDAALGQRIQAWRASRGKNDMMLGIGLAAQGFEHFVRLVIPLRVLNSVVFLRCV